jgi:hypothetical protein
MSSPVNSNDVKNPDDPSFYAPRGARRPEQTVIRAESPPVAPSQTRIPDFTMTKGPEPAAEAPESWPSLPPLKLPPTSETNEAADEAAEPEDHLRAAPTSRMAPGMGGPNLECPPSLKERAELGELKERAGKPENAPLAAARDSESSLDRSPAEQLHAFEGDLAIRALRRRLALSPDSVPEPPVLPELRPRRAFVRPAAFVVGAALIAFCLTVLTLPTAPPTLKRERVIEVTALNTNNPSALLKTARLVLEERRAAFTNEPLQLGISLTGAIGGEFALLTGLAAGTRFSAGAPIGAGAWKLPARELVRAFAVAPRDFIGVMHAAVDLRAGNNTLVDRQTMPLEWVPKQSEGLRPVRVAPQENKPAWPAQANLSALDPQETANLVRRGQDYIKNGDLAAARLVLRRAAFADDPQAAFALAATFDPVVFAELGVLGFQSDVAQARTWYERALKLGSNEAQGRLDRLARVP